MQLGRKKTVNFHTIAITEKMNSKIHIHRIKIRNKFQRVIVSCLPFDIALFFGTVGKQKLLKTMKMTTKLPGDVSL